ncbi:MAG: DUF1573 domain-containing protein [Chitinophagaceae bacterium]|nr:DUF1573 domain-containing protein [Chitinophagaceae bacterium]
MRTPAFILISLLAIASCKDKPAAASAGPSPFFPVQQDSTQFTTIQWIDSTKNYGSINEGQKLEVIFRFKNTGDKPLVIDMIKPSCGCTLVEKPEKPIAPGETGEIKGAFDSNGRPGQHHKTIFVSANTKGSTSHNLEFNVEVIKKA